MDYTMMKSYTNEALKEALLISETTQNEALRWIYQQEKWRKSVDKMVMGMGGDLDQSEDVFQEGIAIFARNIMQGRFNGESALLTYFVGICRFCYLRKIEQNKITSVEMTHHEDKEVDGPEVSMIKQERSESQSKMMRYLLGELKDKCRKILKMYSLKYSMEEIANEMGFEKAQSAKNATMKCRKKLRELIVSNKTIYQKVQEIL